MKAWTVEDAQADFDTLLDTCMSEGPLMVTRRGAETAVLVPAETWGRMQRGRARSFKDLLLAAEPRAELDIPARTAG